MDGWAMCVLASVVWVDAAGMGNPSFYVDSISCLVKQNEADASYIKYLNSMNCLHLFM